MATKPRPTTITCAECGGDVPVAPQGPIPVRHPAGKCVEKAPEPPESPTPPADAGTQDAPPIAGVGPEDTVDATPATAIQAPTGPDPRAKPSPDAVAVQHAPYAWSWQTTDAQGRPVVLATFQGVAPAPEGVDEG